MTMTLHERLIRAAERQVDDLERLSTRCSWTAEIVDGFAAAHAAHAVLVALLRALPEDFMPPQPRLRPVVGAFVRPAVEHEGKYLSFASSEAIFPESGLRVTAVTGDVAIIPLPGGGELRVPVAHFQVLEPGRQRPIAPGDYVVPKEAHVERYQDHAFPAAGLRVAALAGSQAVIEAPDARIHIPVAHLTALPSPALAQELAQLEVRRAELLAALQASNGRPALHRRARSQPPGPRGAAAAAIREALAAAPAGISVTDLAGSTGLRRQTVASVIAMLARARKAHRVAPAVWGPGPG